MKKGRIAAMICVFLAAYPIVNAGAAGIKTYISIEKLIEKYISNSSKTENIILNDNKQQGDNHTIIKSIYDIEKQIEENKTNIDELEDQRYNPDVKFEDTIECQENADKLRIKGYELEMQLEQYKMHEELDLLYAEYSERITSHQQSVLELEAYQLLTNIKLNESKEFYLAAFKEQKQHELDVVRERFKIGYATESDVLAAETEYEQTAAELESCINETALYKLEYEINSGTQAQEFVFENKTTDYSYEKWLKKFKEKSFYSKYYREQGELFKKYSDMLSEMPEKMLKEKNEDRYRICGMNEENTEYFENIISYFTDESAYYSNEAAIYENNAVQYEDNLKLYVCRLCRNAETLLAQQTACETALKSFENQYAIAVKTFEMGRITRLQLLEAETAVYKSRYELAQINAQLANATYILENLIENV